MALSDITVRMAKARDKQYKLSDAAGLHLLIKPNGNKYWRLKYRFAGKEKLLSIGLYPVIGLAEARERCLAAKKQLLENIDPSQSKKEERLKHLINTQNSLENIAVEWHNNKKQVWTEHHASNILRRLQADVFPALGSKAINDIKAPELLTVLRTIETRGAIDVAHRALQTCSQIFRYAVATGRAERDITGDLRGALKTRRKENYSHLKAKELPEFFEKLEQYNGELQTKLALKFLLFTFVRTGEVRGARWAEIDFEKKEWRIPPERMKMRDLHIVPLSEQALQILKKISLINSHTEHLFPNRNKPVTFISENTLLYAIYRMGYHSRKQFMDLELQLQLF